MSLSGTKYESTTPTATGGTCIVRSALQVDPVLREFWWGNMLELGWNRSIYDLQSYLDSTRSRGFLLAYEREDGPPRGHVMAAVFDNGTAWIAMFIMAADLRRSGFGRVLFQAAEEDYRRLQTTYVGLDGVQEQIPTYQRRGFQPSKLGTVKVMSRAFTSKTPLPSVTVPRGMVIKDAKEVDLSWIVAFEKAVTGFERSGLWTTSFFARPDLKAVVLIDESKTGLESIVGFSMVRRCPSGARFSPLYARDEQCAEFLMAHTLTLATPEFVRRCPLPQVEMSDWSEADISEKASITTEVWTGNATALPLFEKYGWREDGVEYARMWLNGKATPEQSEGGAAHSTMFAIFDAAIG